MPELEGISDSITFDIGFWRSQFSHTNVKISVEAGVQSDLQSFLHSSTLTAINVVGVHL